MLGLIPRTEVCALRSYLPPPDTRKIIVLRVDAWGLVRARCAETWWQKVVKHIEFSKVLGANECLALVIWHFAHFGLGFGPYLITLFFQSQQKCGFIRKINICFGVRVHVLTKVGVSRRREAICFVKNVCFARTGSYVS